MTYARHTVTVATERGKVIYTTVVDIHELPARQFVTREHFNRETGRAAILTAADAISHGADRADMRPWRERDGSP
jgi:hypothetical protein